LSASAQTQPTEQPPAVDEARQAFERGVTAMQRQAWPEALSAFEASHRLRRSAAVALNLGVVLHQLRRFTEARVRLQEFMELASPVQHNTHDTEVARLLADSSRRLATLRVTQLLPASTTVVVDGRRVTLNEASETTLDPGEHTVRGEALGHTSFEERMSIAEGVRREVQIVLSAVPDVAVTPPTPTERVVVVERRVEVPTSPPIYTRWWFWTAVGAVVIAGGVTAAVLATRETLPTSSTGLTLRPSALTLEGL
jgi:hypothetical protein